MRNLIGQRRRPSERFSGPVVLEPSEIGVTPMDEAFFTKVLSVVHKNLQDPPFDSSGSGGRSGSAARSCTRSSAP